MNSHSKNILIAGGTGLIGKKLQEKLYSTGHQVYVLTRNKKLVNQDNYRLWNPDQNFIEEDALRGVNVIINLCGAGIADKHWTDARKKELHDSRVKPALVLLDAARKSGEITHYISASGINCYPVNTKHVVSEGNSYGTDYLSRLVKDWETAALQFE
jgi:NAD dependent epimerase/dehydratase family enzyme